MISKQFYRSLSPTHLLFAVYINLVSDIFRNNKFPYDGIPNEANSASTSAATLGLDGAIFLQSEFKCFTVLLRHFDGFWVFQSESIVIHPVDHCTGTCRTLCDLGESTRPNCWWHRKVFTHIRIEQLDFIGQTNTKRKRPTSKLLYFHGLTFVFLCSLNLADDGRFNAIIINNLWETIEVHNGSGSSGGSTNGLNGNPFRSWIRRRAQRKQFASRLCGMKIIIIEKNWSPRTGWRETWESENEGNRFVGFFAGRMLHFRLAPTSAPVASGFGKVKKKQRTNILPWKSSFVYAWLLTVVEAIKCKTQWIKTFTFRNTFLKQHRAHTHTSSTALWASNEETNNIVSDTIVSIRQRNRNGIPFDSLLLRRMANTQANGWWLAGWWPRLAHFQSILSRSTRSNRTKNCLRNGQSIVVANDLRF